MKRVFHALLIAAALLAPSLGMATVTGPAKSGARASYQPPPSERISGTEEGAVAQNPLAAGCVPCCVGGAGR